MGWKKINYFISLLVVLNIVFGAPVLAAVSVSMSLPYFSADKSMAENTGAKSDFVSCPTLNDSGKPCVKGGGGCFVCAQSLQSNPVPLKFTGLEPIGFVRPPHLSPWSGQGIVVDPAPPKLSSIL